MSDFDGRMNKLDVRISELESKRDSLRSDLNSCEKELKERYRERIARRFGITIGMEVTYRGKIFRVEAIDDFLIDSLSRPWLIGVPKKKNGEFGTRRTRLFSYWEKLA